MKKENDRFEQTVKQSRFPASIFGMYLGVLLLMSGIHTGVIVFMGKMRWNGMIQSTIPIIYWSIVAIALTLFTRRQIRKTYEEPMKNLARAAKQVAEGDFSVYIPPLHTMDCMDYLDVMIKDFNIMIEELGSIETLKTDFISNVSHEMKTPIAVIRNYAQLMKAENLPDEQRREFAEAIEQASVRLSSLISNILKLNKLENQRIVAEVCEYDICRQLCDSILQFEEFWEQQGIELEADLEEYAAVRADESLMELVWNNLLSNAIKFTEPGGSITVTQKSEKDRIVVSVKDTGCGMSENCIRHIFDKFYQGDTSHSKEGNGLGLALVKRVLELMNGEIAVISEVGKGSTFIVTLPLGDDRAENGGDEE